MSTPTAAPVEQPAQDEPFVRAWERFFKRHLREAINEAVLGWPARRSLVVDYFDVQRFEVAERERAAQHRPAEKVSLEGGISDLLLHAPQQALAYAEEALKSVDVPVDPRPKLHVRVVNLPVTSTIDVRDLRAEHLGQLVAIRGLVKKATDVQPKLEDAVFQCARCGCILREPQGEHLVQKEPLECYEDQGGCGRDSSFKLIVSEVRGQASRFVDTQKVEIQEAPEGMRGGDQPRRIPVFLEDDLCDRIRPGERVTIVGILRAVAKKDHGVKSTLFDTFLEANSVQRHDEDHDDVATTPEEEAAFVELARDPEVYVKMRNSIAPTLHGLYQEKEVLLLQAFGGFEKFGLDGTRMRGDIHVLLVGDPGVAKSQLLQFMAKLAPRGIYTSGKGNSGAGLTAAAVKDDFGNGRWTLEAGAMVLADRGLLCVDEMDKMGKEDVSSMHEGMEQQSISVAKAGNTTTLQSRCSLLGAANPKMGRFDEFTPIAEQVNFPPALLSRFDVILIVQDKANVERDGLLARHLVRVHRGAALLAQARHDGGDAATRIVAEQLLETVAPPLKSGFLRKFIAHARRTCYPALTEEAGDLLASYYVNLRHEAQGTEKALPITARQEEALIRLATASARVRLSRDITVEDAERAIRIYESYLKRVSGGEGMDVDVVASGVSHSQRQAVSIVTQTIRDLEAGTDHGADYAEVVAKCEQKLVPAEKVQKIVERLKQQGEAYSPRENHVKLTGR